MVSKAAKTVYEAGPLDKVATGDQGAIGSNTATNLLPTTSEDGLSGGALGKLISKKGIGGSGGFFDSALESFATAASGQAPPVKLVDRLQSIVDSGALNPDEIRKRMKEMGNNVDALSGQILSNTLKNAGWIDDATAKNLFGGGLQNSINNVKNAAKGFRMMVDDAEQYIKDIDFTSATGISKLVSELTGQKDLLKVLGIEDTLKGLKLVNDIASAWGIPGLADKLMGTLPNEEDKTEYIINLLPSALGSAHLENINLCIDRIGAKAILAQYPQAITMVLGNYHLPADVYLPTQAQSSALVNTLARLNSDWAYYTRSGQKIFDLGVFGKATDQAKQALGFSDEYKVPAIYAMGRDIRDQTWMEVTKQYYPYF